MSVPEHLMAVDGVTSLCVHRGSTIEWMSLPATLPEENAAALCHAVSRAFSTYAAAERQLTEAYFGLADQSILVIACPASPGIPPGLFLTFLLRDRSAAVVVVPAARAWIKERAPLTFAAKC